MIAYALYPVNTYARKLLQALTKKKQKKIPTTMAEFVSVPPDIADKANYFLQETGYLRKPSRWVAVIPQEPPTIQRLEYFRERTKDVNLSPGDEIVYVVKPPAHEGLPVVMFIGDCTIDADAFEGRLRSLVNEFNTSIEPDEETLSMPSLIRLMASWA